MLLKTEKKIEKLEKWMYEHELYLTNDGIKGGMYVYM